MCLRTADPITPRTHYLVRGILSGESAKRFIGVVGKFKDYRHGSHPWVLEFAHGQVVAFREGEVEPFYPYMALLRKGQVSYDSLYAVPRK